MNLPSHLNGETRRDNCTCSNNPIAAFGDLDLTHEPPAVRRRVRTRGVSNGGVIRGLVMLALIGTLVLLLMAPWITVATGVIALEDAKTLTDKTIPYLLTVVGTAAGYYFGREGRRP